MKNPNRETISRFEELPNVAKAIAADLKLIGLDRPQDLIGKNPLQLYKQLCDITGKKQDPCVLDVFSSIVHFMDGGEPLPWWLFSRDRKRLKRLSEQTDLN